MGRIRTIKPEILTDSKAAKLSDMAWRLWVSSWLIADDAGRFPADPLILLGQIFPNRTVSEVQGALSECSLNGLVHLYSVNGQDFGQIPNWLRHQRINRPSGPKFPAPCAESSLNPHGALTEHSVSPHGGLYADRDHDRDHDLEYVRKRAFSEEALKAHGGLSESASEIVSFLNDQLGTRFRSKSKATRRPIEARLNEGFTVEDFRTVIVDRKRKWQHDEKMREYLRPSTLFGSKFESYLQSANAQSRNGAPILRPFRDVEGTQ